MPEVTNATARFMKRVNTADYEHEEAEFSVSIVFGDNEEADPADLQDAMDMAKDQVLAALRSTGAIDNVEDVSEDDDDANASKSKGSSRRRSRNSKDEDDDAGEDKARSRRRGKKDDGDEADDDDDAPKSRSRRGRGKGKDDEDEKPKTRRRGKKKDDDDEITDADLTKAASEAAEVLSPKAVTRVLKKMGVDEASELDQEERQSFLDTLNEMMEE